MRVPTHEDGSCLFWEFATDHYDVGFGVYFEWSVSQTNTVSVHVSESSDEEELEEEEQARGGCDHLAAPESLCRTQKPLVNSNTFQKWIRVYRLCTSI